MIKEEFRRFVHRPIPVNYSNDPSVIVRMWGGFTIKTSKKLVIHFNKITFNLISLEHFEQEGKCLVEKSNLKYTCIF